MFGFIRNLFRPKEVQPAAIYAWSGERVTCENGHEICQIAYTVHCGELMNASENFNHWTQDQPTKGQYPLPVCDDCGASFCAGPAGGILHFDDGWRYRQNHYATIDDLRRAWEGGNSRVGGSG